MKKLKKRIFRFGVVSAAILPIASLLSCGQVEEKKMTKDEAIDNLIEGVKKLTYFKLQINSSPMHIAAIDKPTNWYYIISDKLRKELNEWIFNYDEEKGKTSKYSVIVNDIEPYLNLVGKALLKFMKPALIPLGLIEYVDENPILNLKGVSLQKSLDDYLNKSIDTYLNVVHNYLN